MAALPTAPLEPRAAEAEGAAAVPHLAAGAGARPNPSWGEAAAAAAAVGGPWGHRPLAQEVPEAAAAAAAR